MWQILLRRANRNSQYHLSGQEGVWQDDPCNMLQLQESNAVEQSVCGLEIFQSAQAGINIWLHEDWKVDVAALKWRAKDELLAAKLVARRICCRRSDAMPEGCNCRICDCGCLPIWKSRRLWRLGMRRSWSVDIAAMWRTCNVLFDLRQQHEERRCSQSEK